MVDTIEIYRKNGLYYVDEVYPSGFANCKIGGCSNIGHLLWDILYSGWMDHTPKKIKFRRSFDTNKKYKNYSERDLVRRVIHEHNHLKAIKEAVRKP